MLNPQSATAIDMDFAIEMATWAQEQNSIAVFLDIENRLGENKNAEQATQYLAEQHGFGGVGEHLVLAKQWLPDAQPRIIGMLRLHRKILDAEATPPIFSNAIILADFLSIPDATWCTRGVPAMLLQTAADFSESLHVGTLKLDFSSADLTPEHRLSIETALLQQEFAQLSDAIWQKKLPLQLPIVRGGVSRAEIERPPATLIGSKTSAELRAIYLQIASLARFELAIYTRDLDGSVLDNAEILDCLRQLSLQKGAHIRILVQSSARALQDGHRLLELARRMSSTFEFRSPQAEDLQYASAFIVNDQNGHVLRDLATRFDSEGNLNDLPSARRLKRYFNEVWERSPVTSEFRRLSF